MKIELKIRRQGGSRVKMGNTTYHFAPEKDDPNGPHVADVTDQAHAERLLSIPGYQEAKATRKGAKADDDSTIPPPMNPDGTEQTAGNADSPAFDTGILSYPNTPNTDENADVQKLDAELVREHERQEEGEGGTQKDQPRAKDNPESVITAKPEDEGKDEGKAGKAAAKKAPAKAAGKTAAKTSK